MRAAMRVMTRMRPFVNLDDKIYLFCDLDGLLVEESIHNRRGSEKAV